jgi:Lon protease-like protein
MVDEQMEISLFPLGLVLFPGMVQPLHIFEPRYREMTKRALDGAGAFGVTLALPEGAFGHEIPARVGSMARILDYHRLPDDRYNLLTVGARRFEIIETHHDQPYLCARVRFFSEELGYGPVAQLERSARALLADYLAIVLADNENGEGGKRGIAVPDDPIELSYFIAVLLPCDDQVKQVLLEATSAGDRLALELDLLRIETTRARDAVESTAEEPAPGPRNPHNTGSDGLSPGGRR